ncbi:MAG: DUF2760 domain-containing protein [Candidatus Scalindua sp. SCAELEC01]|nr:DUF2760 domain-containing protein [Planctomycetota bacterium]RZV69640.1 MAG: DUF2760 domain-containing protein [Candidatus Scalindua sp. SCAELEC01]
MKRSITAQSAIIIFLCNAFLIALYFFLLKYVFKGISEWEDPYPTVQRLTHLMRNPELTSIIVLFSAGAVLTIVSWVLVWIFGNRVIRRNREPGGQPTTKVVKSQKKNRKALTADNSFVPSPQRASLQMLIILQRKGRLLDFLQEDLSQFDDAQIGAAVRNIHSGCKESLSEYIDLEPIFKEEEGKEVSIPKGFDSKAIQLTGNVKGEPPFRGILRHRGWRASRVKFPQLTAKEDKDNVLAPAEIEIA